MWQGRYRKNFTYYDVMGVNLGKLEPGKYRAKWIVMPQAFNTVEGSGQLRENWPQNEHPLDQEPIELSVSFTVVEATP